MDWEFIGAHVPDYLGGAWVTLRFGLYGVGCSLAVGLLCCLIRYFRIPVARSVARGYIELARNTPLLVQLFFLYAGLPRVGIRLSAESCAVIGLTFLGGAYMAEAFRSGNMGIMDYYRMKNIQADTDMRTSIATPSTTAKAANKTPDK